MSTQSDALCLAIVNGHSRATETLCKFEWKRGAEHTLQTIVDCLPTTGIHERDEFDVKFLPRVTLEKDRSLRPHFVYLARCATRCGTLCMAKVGVASHVPSRMRAHETNPLLVWKNPVVHAVASKRFAADIETAFLATAAKKGLWLGGEFVACCSETKRLCVQPGHLRRDSRYRVRGKELANGI